MSHEPKVEPKETSRKPYHRPELTFYGDVAQVTRGEKGMMKKDAGGAATKMCWMAAALYGEHAPRTTLVRAWLNASYEQRSAWALIAIPIYRSVGPVIARGLPSSATLRQVFRPLFDRAVRRAHRRFAVYAVRTSRTSISRSE